MGRSRRWLAAAGGVALTIALGSASPAAGQEVHEEPSVVGQAEMKWPAGQRVYFRVNAHGFLDGARGVLRIEHTIDGTLYWQDATVDCLVTGGPVATVTAILTGTNVTELKETLDKYQGSTRPEDLARLRRGIIVYDGGRQDRLGYSWLSDAPLEPCRGTAPFLEAKNGGFTVRHWVPETQG